MFVFYAGGMMLSLRVLLVAADPLVRAGLAALLAEEELLELVGQVDTAESSTAVLPIYQPDVVLLDAGTNARLDGSRWSDLAVPTVALIPPENETRPWPTGIHGLLPRSATAEQITAALQAVVVGLRVSDISLPWPLAPEIAPPAGDTTEPLTPREQEVLLFLAEGLTNKAIAQALGISPHTVKFHVTAVLGKLHAQSRTEAVVAATRAGLLPL